MFTGKDGLPEKITVTRPASVHGVIAERVVDLLAHPVTFELWRDGSALVVSVTKPAAVWRTTPATVYWSAEFTAGRLRLRLNASLAADGYMDYAIALSDAASSDESDESSFEVDDIRLRIEWLPQPKDRLYFMGVGVLGQALSANTSVAWKWSLAKQNAFMWAGSPSA